MVKLNVFYRINAGKAQMLSRQFFNQMIDGQEVIETCQKVAQGQKDEKKNLPIICWHASFKNGERKNEQAEPSGLVLLDVDHIDDPEKLFQEAKNRLMGWGLLAAHKTPSTKGLRVVLPLIKGLNIPQSQRWYAEQLGWQVDTCTKDLARASFIVPRDYWYFVDEDRLFGDGLVEPVEVKMKAVPAPIVNKEEEAVTERSRMAWTEVCKLAGLLPEDVDKEGSRHGNLLAILTKGLPKLLTRGQVEAVVREKMPSFWTETDCKGLLSDFWEKYKSGSGFMSRDLLDINAKLNRLQGEAMQMPSLPRKLRWYSR